MLYIVDFPVGFFEMYENDFYGGDTGVHIAKKIISQFYYSDLPARRVDRPMLQATSRGFLDF